MAIGFMSFGGMLTGGNEAEVKKEKIVKIDSEDDKTEDNIVSIEHSRNVANNTKAIE